MVVSIGIVFLAGVASFLSPCVISLVPVYIAILAGDPAVSANNSQLNWKTLLKTGLFILGFSVVFIVLGLSVTTLGRALFQFKDWIARIGGLIIIILGLQTIGIIDIPFLNYEKMVLKRDHWDHSYVSAFLLGIGFSAGWSPCIGPILGTILTAIISAQLSPVNGALLLAVYSAGMGIPFFILGTGTGLVLQKLKSKKRVLHIVQQVMGILMVILGVLLVAGVFANLARFGSPILEI